MQYNILIYNVLSSLVGPCNYNDLHLALPVKMVLKCVLSTLMDVLIEVEKLIDPILKLRVQYV